MHHAIDLSVCLHVHRVLPLCNCYVRVNRFVSERSQYEFGKVAHALSAGMRRLLREYLVLIAQLENQLLQVILLDTREGNEAGPTVAEDKETAGG